MQYLIKQERGNEGSVTVIALLIFVILTLLGVSATITSRTEVQIAGNDRFRIIAFENADSGVYATPKVISACMDNNGRQPWQMSPITVHPGLFTMRSWDSIPMMHHLNRCQTDSSWDLFWVPSTLHGCQAVGNRVPGRGGTEFASGAEELGQDLGDRHPVQHQFPWRGTRRFTLQCGSCLQKDRRYAGRALTNAKMAEDILFDPFPIPLPWDSAGHGRRTCDG
jgi:hypothetical protein